MWGPMIDSLFLGFALGLQHSTDSDHLVAVTALASESGGARRSAVTGAFGA
jgi:high-affinity nickel permease